MTIAFAWCYTSIFFGFLSLLSFVLVEVTSRRSADFNKGKAPTQTPADQRSWVQTDNTVETVETIIIRNCTLRVPIFYIPPPLIFCLRRLPASSQLDFTACCNHRPTLHLSTSRPWLQLVCLVNRRKSTKMLRALLGQFLLIATQLFLCFLPILSSLSSQFHLTFACVDRVALILVSQVSHDALTWS